VVLESHDYVYGPGGQGVYQDPINGPVSNLFPSLT
jgi:arabinan endo-1,5-alpha-L-arabinosidase